jgi:hypothetical protein
VLAVSAEFATPKPHDVWLRRGDILGPPLLARRGQLDVGQGGLWPMVARDVTMRIFGADEGPFTMSGGLWPAFRVDQMLPRFSGRDREAAVSNLVRRALLGERVRLVYERGEDMWHGEALRDVVRARLSEERSRLSGGGR